MKIRCIGASGAGATGFCYIAETRQVRIMIECGMFQGRRKRHSGRQIPGSYAISAEVPTAGGTVEL